MDEQQQTLVDYITQQLQIGQTPDEVSSQLQAAGWPIEHVHRAFLSMQSQTIPAAMQPQEAHHTHPQTEAPRANGKRRGRIRTGWILFKQSMKILNGNRYLFRYMLMTWAVVMMAEVTFFAIIYFAYSAFTDSSGNDTPLWYAFIFLSYLLTYFIINFYAAALASNIFDIFRGQRQPYAIYVAAARAKTWPIFVFSLIDAIIGMLLRYVVERIKWIGRILVWLLGTLWSLGAMFVLPIIMSTDTSAPSAIKSSVRFFKQTWGENITAKVTVNTPLALINIILWLIFVPLFIITLINGSFAAALIVLFVYLFLAVSLAILGSFANNLVSVALYYYAVTREVPPGFSSDMLNGVFIKRKRHFFKKGNE